MTNTSAESTMATNLAACPMSFVTMASVWWEPWALMKDIASSRESTMRTATMRSSYSVSQSSGDACSALMRARVRPSPLISTPLSLNLRAISGRNPSAIDESTRRFSMALHTAGYCVFESRTMFHAVSISASLSTYTWQTPAACPSTGILVLSWMYFTNWLEPRGMSRSMYSSRPRITPMSSLVSIRTNASAGTPWDAAASLRMRNRACIECNASRPPLNATALPDFRHRDMICGTTSGRDSKMTPSMPMGHLT